jgi:hypothetical protein
VCVFGCMTLMNVDEDAENRLMKTIHAGLTRQFFNTMQLYFAVQDRHKKQYRTIVEQQVKIGTIMQFLKGKHFLCY